MNKSKFLELVRNPELIEEKDLTKLQEISSEHPYSQIVHVLNVKARKAHQKPDFEKSLNLAATYVYDRQLLRAILEGTSINEPTAKPQITTSEVPEETKGEIEEVSDFEWIEESTDEEEEFMMDTSISDEEIPKTEATSETNDGLTADGGLGTKLDHQEASEELPESDAEPVTAEIVEASKDGETSGDGEDIELQKQSDSEPLTEPAKVSESEEVTSELESEETLEQEDEESPEQEAEGLPALDDAESIESKGEEILNLEIESGGIHAELMQNLSQLQESKQQYENPEKNGDPQSRQEQIEIIDNFIKNSPVLSKPNLSADSESTSQADLSKGSTKLNDELASENLAKIYSKQGKRKDAEKIYKKLIIKFPQKKAYFADQIQKLKKK